MKISTGPTAWTKAPLVEFGARKFVTLMFLWPCSFSHSHFPSSFLYQILYDNGPKGFWAKLFWKAWLQISLDNWYTANDGFQLNIRCCLLDVLWGSTVVIRFNIVETEILTTPWWATNTFFEPGDFRISACFCCFLGLFTSDSQGLDQIGEKDVKVNHTSESWWSLSRSFCGQWLMLTGMWQGTQRCYVFSTQDIVCICVLLKTVSGETGPVFVDEEMLRGGCFHGVWKLFCWRCCRLEFRKKTNSRLVVWIFYTLFLYVPSFLGCWNLAAVFV